MRCDILTLFPDMVRPVFEQSILKRAQEKGLLSVYVHNLRDHTHDRHRTADDEPYGGGAGMVMKAEPIFEAVEARRTEYQRAGLGTEIRVILPSPKGQPFSQSVAKGLARETKPILFICGHYEGIDERVRIGLNPEELSLGDYVVTGGELPAVVMIDAAARLIPGVLGHPDSSEEESFADALLEYPHYTRPVDVRGLSVPDVLLSGHHDLIRRWRRKESLRRTLLKRPDLLRDREFTAEDRQLLDEILQESASRAPVQCGEEG